jgi:hypothetical protein
MVSERAIRLRKQSDGDRKRVERWQRERDALPGAGLAQKLYGSLSKPNLNDASRGATSPLGGLAVQTKPQRRGRR